MLNALPGDAAAGLAPTLTAGSATYTAGTGPQRKEGVRPVSELGAEGSEACTRKRQ
jgi:hypothetical protein